MRFNKESFAAGYSAAKNWTHEHRQAITATATAVVTVAWILAPEPSGKIAGAALIGRNLATLGFGSTRLGLAIASSSPAFAGWLAGKVGSDRKSNGVHR